MFQSPGGIALELGSLQIHWYGIIIGLGILFCYFFILSELKRRKIDQKPIDDMAFWVISSGIIGARLYYVIFNLSYFSANPIEILQIWKGGLAIHGALLGGAAAYFIYIFRKKLSWTLYADIIIPGILLAQTLGRWGNFFNNEAFGRPTSLPWGVFIPEQNRPTNYKDFSNFHPTFLYESLWDLIGFCILVFLSRRLYRTQVRDHHPHGIVFFAYLIWYSLGRFFIEGLRTDSLYFAHLRVAQLASAILAIIGVSGLLFLRKRHRMRSL